jgi:hypothetical protein
MNLSLLIPLCLVLVLTACATPPLTVSKPQLPDAEDEYWWYVRFRQPWPEGEPAAWHKDVLLADRIVAPVLAEHRESISLWRIHRRAARDGAGHQFSFIFRTTPTHAAQINARIASDPLLRRLVRAKVVERVSYDDPAEPQRPGIADTSDRNWTPEMQRAWPQFIMGVSQLWLELIREIEQAGADWPEELEARYAAIGEELDELWLHQGGHALLHHLSAVFGYREVQVIRREPMRF